MKKGHKIGKIGRENISRGVKRTFELGRIAQNKNKSMKESSKKKLCESLALLYKSGYINPMKGKKRPDLSEYNKKYKSSQVCGDANPNKRPEVIAKRLRTIAGRTKEIYGRPGPLNPNWRGGSASAPYTYEFNQELRLAVKIRDDFKCKICHKCDKNTPQGLHTHHIDYDKTNNKIDNLVSLCPNCHGKTNSNKQRWILYFSRMFSMKKTYFTWDDITKDCNKVANFLRVFKPTGIVPIIRGGVFPALVISNILDVPLKMKVELETDVIIDEIVDFGMTFRTYKRNFPKNLFVSLHLNTKNFKYEKKPDFFAKTVRNYIVYPWEKSGVEDG